ncbi:CD166 antigen-like [Narcine bancroftii]|uniref:CD166 antigen-like n=1 Tax=Narcine bancroftii TaxID=1343680 RepID=UPI003831F1C7
MGAWRPGLLQQLLILFLGAQMQVHSVTSITAMVGDNVTLACEARKEGDLFFVAWRVKLSEDKKEQLISFTRISNETEDKGILRYKGRLIMNKDFSLSILNVGIQDEKIFSCSTFTGTEILESFVSINIYKRPSNPEIIQPAPFLVAGKLQQVGLCVVKDSYPTANITWKYNIQNLDISRSDVKIFNESTINSKGFFDTTSTLKYMPKKGEERISFSCQVTYLEGLDRSATKVSSSVDMFVHYNTSKISLQVSPAKDILEGTNVTLLCSGDGYPSPEVFLFTKNGEEIVVGEAQHELIKVTQEDTGEYACSQLDKTDIKDSVNITVHHLALTMSPSESVSKMVGENLTMECTVESSGNADVTLMKKNKVNQNPFVVKSLQYAHSGNYTCQAKLKDVKEMKREKSIIVRVEGKPRIIKLAKTVVNKSKVISCVVEGFPKPAVQWNINGTFPKEEPIKDKRSQWCHQITVQPSGNITVTCTAINTHGEDQNSVHLTASSKSKNDKNSGDNQAKVIVGVIIGLLIAAVIAGMIYWLYKKKSKTNERGTADEIKKINKGENNHTSSSSAV